MIKKEKIQEQSKATKVYSAVLRSESLVNEPKLIGNIAIHDNNKKKKNNKRLSEWENVRVLTHRSYTSAESLRFTSYTVSCFMEVVQDSVAGRSFTAQQGNRAGIRGSVSSQSVLITHHRGHLYGVSQFFLRKVVNAL